MLTIEYLNKRGQNGFGGYSSSWKSMFDWIGFHTNIGKTVIMEFQPCHKIGGHSVEPYGLSMTGDHLRHQ